MKTKHFLITTEDVGAVAGINCSNLIAFRQKLSKIMIEQLDILDPFFIVPESIMALNSKYYLYISHGDDIVTKLCIQRIEIY